MKVLLDEGVPHPLAHALAGHEVQTVSENGWSGVKNGRLLELLEISHFEVFITGDKNLTFQQDVLNRPFAILVLSTIHWPILRKNVDSVMVALDQAKRGDVCSVTCGEFVPRRFRSIEKPLP